MTFSVDDTLQAIDQVHKRRQFNEHPVWKGLIEGTHSLAMVREYTKQSGIIPLHNHNYHGRLYVQCPDPKWRAMIAEVVYEEGTGRLYADGVSHNELYYRFGEGLGISRDELYNTHYCAGAVAIRNYYTTMCGGDFLDGVAAHMLGGEAQGPGFLTGIANKLQENFGLSDAQVAFWVVHDSADEDHSNIGRDLLDQFAPTEHDRRRVLRVVEETQMMMTLLDDDTWRCMQQADQGSA